MSSRISGAAGLLFAVLAAGLAAESQPPAPSGSCNQAASEAVAFVTLPGRPFSAIPTADGCWIFVTLSNPAGGPPPGVAVLSRRDGVISVLRVIPTERGVTGAVLTHDGQVLIAAHGERVAFFDVAAMTAGSEGAVLGYLQEPAAPSGAVGAVYVNVTSDDRFLFVSDEAALRVTVVNLEKARRSGFQPDAIVGTIPTGRLPIALTFSPGEKFLYTTSESAAPEWNWPADCKREGANAAPAAVQPQGAIVVVDVERAKTDPPQAVVSKAPAGCSAVRLAISPKGETAYVTARNSDSLLAFDTAKLIQDPLHAQIAKVPVGVAPVGVTVVDGGKKVLTANSNRFAASPSGKSTLTVINAAKITSGKDAILGTVVAGAFPREMKVTADGKTLLVTNFASQSLQIVDVARLPK